jgi:hypothetical protein
MVDGKQYVLVAAGDTLFSFTLNPEPAEHAHLRTSISHQ